MNDENDTSRTRNTLTGDDISAIVSDFENQDFTPAELITIRKTRRRSPRLGEARAEVYTFRAPPSYKRRIREQAAAQDVTESQVIRDALDAYSSRRSRLRSSTRHLVSPSRHEPHRCLETAAQEVRAFADAIRAGTMELHPNADCPWHEDIPALVRAMQLDNGATARISGLGHRSTLPLLWSVTDHLYALSNCVDDRTLFSVSSLARIALEAAASAVWLNDDGLDAETTLARHVKLHQKSLKAECNRLGIAKERIGLGERASHVGGLLTKYTFEMDECATTLSHLGETCDSKVPKKTAIVREVLSQANLSGLAQLSYGAHSSIVHSEPFMLLNSLDVGGEVHSDMQMQKSMTVRTKLTPVLEALAASSLMVKTVSRWWDNKVDTLRLDEVVDRVQSIGRQFNDEPSEKLSE